MRLRTDWSRGLSQQTSEGGLDAALILLPASSRPPAGLQGRCVGSLKTVIIQQKRGSRFRRPIKLAHLAKEAWVLNPLGCGYRAALEAAMGQRDGGLRVAIDTYGTDVQIRMVASGHGLGLVPRAALSESLLRGKISVVDVCDFSLSLDVWITHRQQPGNLHRALEVIGEVATACLEKSP